MILSIYKVTEVSTNESFYDLELNNFICGLGTDSGLSWTISRIEDGEEIDTLIYNELISLDKHYKSFPKEVSITLITSIEFEDHSDLRNRLRPVLETSHPELLI